MDLGVLILGFSRPTAFERAARSIQNLGVASNVKKYAFIDGSRAKSDGQVIDNSEVVSVGEKLLEEGQIDYLTVRDRNLGTMLNVVYSVSEVLQKHEYIFVLEDDLEVLEVAGGSLSVMLNKLSGNNVAISLYAHRSFIDKPFLSRRFSSQAWATSRTGWANFEPQMYKQHRFTAHEKLEIKRALGSDFLPSVRAYQRGRLDSWAIPWNLFNFFNHNYMIYPAQSLIRNHSHLEGAERTLGYTFRYEIAHMPIVDFSSDELSENFKYLRHFSSFQRLQRRITAEMSRLHAW